MERKFSFCEDEFYHVYNRGTEKRLIFQSNADYLYFQKLLFLCNSVERIQLRSIPKSVSVFSLERKGTLVDIGSYCQMPNHFHLLLYEKKDKGISTFMSKLTTAYAVYFNHKYKRTGALFEGCFKAIHVDDDQYMQYLFSYIGLNPIKCIQSDWKEIGIRNLAEAREYLGNYKHSSYLDQVGTVREENSILENKNFPEYFAGATDFENFVDEWLAVGTIFNTDGSDPLAQDSLVQSSWVDEKDEQE